MERVYSFPSAAKHYYCFTKDTDIKQHANYNAAKSGCEEAAFNLVRDLAHEFLLSLKGQFPEGANYVAPYAKEAGGMVLGSIVLVNAGRDKSFTPVKKHIKLLEERFHDKLTQQFGIHTSALTANEASYLVGFRTFDEIRNRCIKAKKETHLRLLSKGIT